MWQQVSPNKHRHTFYQSQAEPHSSVGSVAHLRTRGYWFDPRFGHYSFRGLMIAIATGFIPLTTIRCFHNDYVGKQPVAWKEYCAEYWLKELQESMYRCTGRRDMTEILFKTALNTIQSFNQFTNHKIHSFHSESVLRCRPVASIYRLAEKQI